MYLQDNIGEKAYRNFIVAVNYLNTLKNANFLKEELDRIIPCLMVIIDNEASKLGITHVNTLEVSEHEQIRKSMFALKYLGEIAKDNEILQSDIDLVYKNLRKLLSNNIIGKAR